MGRKISLNDFGRLGAGRLVAAAIAAPLVPFALLNYRGVLLWIVVAIESAILLVIAVRALIRRGA
jgi:hypothetical protein